MMDLTIIKELVTAFAAFIGMGLGIYNFFRERSKEKVKLKIIPKAVIRKGSNSLGQGFVLTSETDFKMSADQNLFAVEIINLSKFPVVIDEVGFLIKGEKGRMSLPTPILGDQGKWPRKLDARESVTVYGDLKYLVSSPSLIKITAAFAKTACGHTDKGSSQALTKLIKLSKEVHNNRLDRDRD